MFWLNKPIHNFSRNAPILSGKNQSDPKAIAQRAGGISLVQPPMRSHEYFFSTGGDRSCGGGNAIAQPISKVKLFKENVGWQ
jgi:hypothetical protein